MCRAGSVGKGRQGGRVVWVVRWRVDIDRERAVAREGGWLVGWLAHGARLERARGGWRRRPRRSGDGWRVWREGRAPPVVTRPVPRARVQLHPLRSSVCVRVRESKCKKTVCASLRRTNEAGGGGRVTTTIIIIIIRAINFAMSSSIARCCCFALTHSSKSFPCSSAYVTSSTNTM